MHIYIYIIYIIYIIYPHVSKDLLEHPSNHNRCFGVIFQSMDCISPQWPVWAK